VIHCWGALEPADTRLSNGRFGGRCDRRAGRRGNRRHTFRCRPGESRIVGAVALRHWFLLAFRRRSRLVDFVSSAATSFQSRCSAHYSSASSLRC
jgi:hypothetical protein